MEKVRLDKIAEYLVSGYLDALAYSRQFMDDHEAPPSLMAKIHHMRAAVQAAIAKDDCLDLHSSYTEYGRVQFSEVATGDQFLLRSAATVKIEKAKHEQLEFFTGLTPVNPSGVLLLVYQFSREGVSLSIAESVRRQGRVRLETAGTPTYVGLWPYISDERSAPFDQINDDSFEDLGDPGDEIGEVGGDK